MLKGKIQASFESKAHIESLGIILGDYDTNNNEFVVLSAPNECIEKLEPHFGEYVWLLVPTNGFDFATDKLAWFRSAVKVNGSMCVKTLGRGEPDWCSIAHVSKTNDFFVLEKYNGYGHNAVVEFRNVKFVPQTVSNPYPDRFCMNGWLFVKPDDIVIP